MLDLAGNTLYIELTEVRKLCLLVCKKAWPINNVTCQAHCIHQQSTMAKSQKTRLQTYHAKDIISLEKKSMLLSHTSKCLQKVVTSVPTPASHTQKPDEDDGCLNGQAEMIEDDGIDLYADVNTNVTSCADFEHPAALHVRTKAKRYQNSVP